MSVHWLALAKRIRSTVGDTGFRLSGVKYLYPSRTLRTGAAVAESRIDRHYYINDWDINEKWRLRAVWRAWIGLVATCLALGQVKTVISCNEDFKVGADTFYILPTRTRQRQFFKYERRLRENSSAEKIFEYFANTRGEKGEPLMTEEDVMRSFCPVYPPSGSKVIRSGSLPGEGMDGINGNGHVFDPVRRSSSVLGEMMKLDGQDGISLHEWLLIDALISFPIHDIHILFRLVDTDGNGVIDVEELLKLFVAAQRRSSLDHTGLQGSHRGLLESALQSSSLVKGLIKDHQKSEKVKGITIEDLEDFCQSLRNDLLRLEFNYYSQGAETISGENLAISLVSCADIQVIDRYLDRVDGLPEKLKNAVFDFEDYRTVSKVISKIKDLASAAVFHVKIFGPIDRGVFGKLVCQIKKDTGPISQSSLDILFHLFSDSNGTFHVDDMYGVLKYHFQNRTVGVNNTDIPAQESFLACCLNCLRYSARSPR